MNENSWHLDKRVPIALIITLFIQTAGMIWWAATLNQRVVYLEMQVSTQAGQDTRLTKLETRMESIIDALIRIEKKLD